MTLIRALPGDQRWRPYLGRPLWFGGHTPIQPVVCLMAFGTAKGEPWTVSSAISKAAGGEGGWILKMYGGRESAMDALSQAVEGQRFGVPCVVVMATSLLARHDAGLRPDGWYVDGTVLFVNPAVLSGHADIWGLREEVASGLAERHAADMEAACPHYPPSPARPAQDAESDPDRLVQYPNEL